MDWTGSIVMWGTIIIFNLAILQLLRVTLGKADFEAAMREKAPVMETETTTTLQQTPAGNAVPVQTDKKVSAQPLPPETSYSRVAGMIGAVVLACFVWAVGNVLLYKMFMAQDEVSGLLTSLGSYFLAGASLFAPYAVNQLGNAFKTR
jgi:hypothetical protein